MKNKITDIAKEFSIAPAESPAKIKRKRSKLFIGLPKETSFQEKRVALTPEAVSVLVNNGHDIVIESKVGEASHFHDAEYSEAGAKIVRNKKEVYKAEIIIKVAPPTNEEVKLLQHHQIVISPIHLPALKENYLKTLMAKKVTCLAFEYIKDESGRYPIIYSMSEIAGNSAIFIAAEYLSNINKGKGILLGGISGVSPAKILILGSGVVGESATRTALGLGADVKIFDTSIYKLMRLQNNIGRRLFTCIIQPKILLQELQTADVAIGAIHAEDGRAPCIVTEQMVSKMKAGAMIIDVSIDQGGCFETSEITTHDEPTFKKFDVLHYCVPNIPSRVARTASYAISNILTPTLLQASEDEGFERALGINAGLRHGVYVYKGSLTNEHLSEKFNIKFTDLDLLFAASF